MQKSKIIKAHYQLIYLLETKYIRDNKCQHISIFITGSTLNVYNVKIFVNRLECDCGGYEYCLKNKLFCKHCCFVLCCVGGIFDEDVFISNSIKPHHYAKLISGLVDTRRKNTNIYNDFLSNKFALEKNKTHIRNIDTECPICYDILNGNDIISKCLSCLNGVHEQCFEKWLKFGNCCVFCKSTKIISNRYINLSR
jgi:hypothetical protein